VDHILRRGKQAFQLGLEEVRKPSCAGGRKIKTRPSTGKREKTGRVLSQGKVTEKEKVSKETQQKGEKEGDLRGTCESTNGKKGDWSRVRNFSGYRCLARKR